MNSGHSTPSYSSNFAPPHLSHAEPWGSNYICCDVDHNASTSRPWTPTHRSHQSASTGFPATATGCCDDTHCSDTAADVVECCTDPACRAGAICEDEGCHFPHNPDALPGDPDSAESMRALERWACSKEGCHAIQQYLECCTQDDCSLPVCTDAHPSPVVCNHDGSSVPNDQLNQAFMTGNGHMPTMFDPSQLPPAPWSQPLALANSTTNSGNMATTLPTVNPVVQNVCHWQNCHQIFGTTPELLAHIAADHLNAPGVATAPSAKPPVDQNIVDSMANILGTSAEPSHSSGHTFDMSSLQFNGNGVDPLMSCLWDDCFPSNPDPTANGAFGTGTQQINAMNSSQHLSSMAQSMSAPMSSLPTVSSNDDHIHSHGHAHGHGHPHAHPTGEPFSPQTMLRHVLEEHLGLNPGDLSWTAPLMPPPVPTSTPILPSVSSAATTPVITPVHPVKPHHHHIPILPTPSPSTYTSSPPPQIKGLICLWPGCRTCSPFADTASLMSHLSEEHIGKCKNTYTCLWDTCGHAGGREFKSRQKVLRHLQSHIGHKPYICEVCDQAFSEAAPLAAHKRRHAQEKPFKCEHPGCGKTFAISSSLTIHMRTHNGEKPFVCPHCDKGFVEASNLTKHIRTHTGERPFSCSYPGCEKRFPRPDQLKRHMAIHDADRHSRGKKGSRNNSVVELAAPA